MQVTFNADMITQGEWHHYDGLMEYHDKGSGLVKEKYPMHCQTYWQSKALYVKD